ncbi:phage late control D family protein [Limobrevibacterium gyesilva]|uniref:Contractile injection system protein, VgrG/Pvc8 family n=1 Tax=Limobrevibacterium gyesilva TaxID=2991712 RepID=A0AA42CK81_9PROT|nr:contractile injection system protein, VgrG/Pvc8 family [Limobrevibacterium gyesilva]MCW3477647.1 contractile injection system protein, VgrG/Pvc8 family [Limobrevibacterium gyesilva]
MSGVLDFGVRRPRLRVLADGALVGGVIDAEVINNNHYAADRFRLTAADPAGFAALAGRAELQVDVQVSLDGGFAFTSLIQGAVDTVEIDVAGGTVHLDGRDLSAALIEARTQETFANNTASEIAEQLAARHGLTPDVQRTTTPAGRYWQLEHDRIVLNQFGRATTEWDLLVTLAQFEGFDVWVSGTTLHFRPPPAAVAAAVLRAADVTGLRLERSLTLARDIQVTVKSWNSRQQNAFVQTARRRTASRESGRVQNYVYVVPNLTPDEALKYAQARLAELTQHERVVSAEMPGDLALMPRMMLRLEGTGTAFDQDYWIDRVERQVSVAHGFTQSLRAKNASTGSQATAPGDKVISVWTAS